MRTLRPLQTLAAMAAPAMIALGAAAFAGIVIAAPKPAPKPGSAPPAATAKPAAAQGSGLLGSSTAPIDVSSENSEMLQDEHRQVFWGNVEAIQGESRLRTPRLTTYYTPRDANAPKPAAGAIGVDPGQVERIEAEGPVFYVTPTQKAKGDHATYLASNDTITMTGNVVLVQDKDVATGDKLVIEQKNGHATLSSNPGKPGQQRVRAVLYPSQNNAQPGTAGAAPAQPPKPAGRP